jgi:hypothetical protein
MAARTNLVDVDTVLRQRIEGSIDWFIKSLSRDAKIAVLGSIDVPQLVFRLARNTPSTDPGETEAAQQLARTAEFKRELLQRAGGQMTTKQVRNLLGYKSVQAVHKAVVSRRVLAVDDNGTKLFPAFQFDGDHVIVGMAAILAATPTTSPWALLQFLVEGDDGLGDDRPIDLIRGGLDSVQRLARFARTLED